MITELLLGAGSVTGESMADSRLQVVLGAGHSTLGAAVGLRRSGRTQAVLSGRSMGMGSSPADVESLQRRTSRACSSHSTCCSWLPCWQHARVQMSASRSIGCCSSQRGGSQQPIGTVLQLILEVQQCDPACWRCLQQFQKTRPVYMQGMQQREPERPADLQITSQLHKERPAVAKCRVELVTSNCKPAVGASPLAVGIPVRRLRSSCRRKRRP